MMERGKTTEMFLTWFDNSNLIGLIFIEKNQVQGNARLKNEIHTFIRINDQKRLKLILLKIFLKIQNYLIFFLAEQFTEKFINFFS